jgi:hypothetical protein
MGNDSASSAQSKRRQGSGTSGGVGVIFHSGVLTNSLCRREERELCNSGCGFITTGNTGFLNVSGSFNEHGFSLSRGIVCTIAVLRSGLRVVWVPVSTMVGAGIGDDMGAVGGDMGGAATWGGLGSVTRV